MLGNKKTSAMDLFMLNLATKASLTTPAIHFQNAKNHLQIRMLLGFWLKFIKLIFRFYKLVISPILPSSCRFYPTCSHFAYLTFAYSNPFFALKATLYRLLRCQPFCKGGFDYPIIFTTMHNVDSSLASPRRPSFIPHICVWFVPLAANTKDSKKPQNYFLIPSLMQSKSTLKP